jgi:hypothetical protein
MFCRVSVEPAAYLSIQRMCRNRSPTECIELWKCASLLARWLQYDPNLQGRRSGMHIRKALNCGPIYAWYEIRPPIERHVIIWEYGRNLNWAR